MKGLFVTGTDTDVGKTFITAGLARALRSRQFDVGVAKPIQSGARADDPSGDAMVLKELVELDDPVEWIAPLAFLAPLAPLIAAEREGVEIRLDDLLSGLTLLGERHDALLVEGAGGLLAPLGPSATNADLARALRTPLLIVARAGLGTVNHVCLTAEVARRRGLEVIGVILNGAQDGSSSSNRRLVEDFAGIAVIGETPLIVGELTSARLECLIDQNVDLAPIVASLEAKGVRPCLPSPLR